MTDEQKIWEALLNLTENPYGAAGLMGNLYAESGLRPNNLQDSKEGALGMTDDSYTAAVDYGLYKDFETDRCGYGLAQFTTESRKRALREFARERETSVGDLDMQLLFIGREMAESFPKVLAGLKAAESVREASDLVLVKYERPKDQSERVKEKRAAYGERFLERYGRTSSGADAWTPHPSASPPPSPQGEGLVTGEPSHPQGEGMATGEDETVFFSDAKGGKAMFTNLQLKAFADAVYDQKWVYWYGTYGKRCTKALYDEKKRQYPEQYTASRENGYMTDIRNGHRCADCAGLIKAFYWCGADPDALPTYGSNGFADRGADSIFRLCRENGKIGSIPELPGVLVWRSGHIGVYVGGGMTIEMKGFAYDCVRQKVTSGTWTHWGKLPPELMEYAEGPHPSASQTPSPTGEGFGDGKTSSGTGGTGTPHPSAAPTPSPTGEGYNGDTSSGADAPPSPTGEGKVTGRGYFLVIHGGLNELIDLQAKYGGKICCEIMEA